MFVRRLLRLMLPHMVIIGGLAALYHAATAIEQGPVQFAMHAMFGFGWHALGLVAISLPMLGIALFFRRALTMWRRRQLRKFLERLDEGH